MVMVGVLAVDLLVTCRDLTIKVSEISGLNKAIGPSALVLVAP